MFIWVFLLSYQFLYLIDRPWLKQHLNNNLSLWILIVVALNEENLVKELSFIQKGSLVFLANTN